MPWPKRDFTTRLLAGVVGAILAAAPVFIFLVVATPMYTTPTRVPWIGAAIAASVGFITAFLGGDRVVRFLARLLARGRGAV